MSRVLASAAAALLVLALHGRAYAAQPAEELDEIVVTGSNIPAGRSTSVVPVTVLDRADLERGNRSSAGAILQALPFNTGSPLNTSMNNGGDGSERIDLRGLGPQRTVVLLNGRRFLNGGIGADASVDLTSIPVGMIERVEVLTSDATAIYGADAVAGVVNVLTRDRFHGLELDANRSQTSRHDGGITQVQALAGTQLFAAGEIQAGLDYVNQLGVKQDRRAYSAESLVLQAPDEPPAYQGSGASAYGLIVVPGGNKLGLSAGRYVLRTGAPARSAADYARATLADSFNTLPYNYSQTPSERLSGWLQGSLPLTGQTTLFVEVLGSRRNSSQRLAPTPYFSNIDGAPLLADGSNGIPASNYYNPFGVNLAVVRRRFVEIDDRGFEENVHLWRAIGGLRGSLRAWQWELYAGDSQSVATTRENGLIPLDRLLPAVGPSGPDATGRIVCGVPGAGGIVPAANIVPGCVPVDLFHGPGSVTPAQVAYLQQSLRDRGSNSQQLVNLNAVGTAGSISGRPVSVSMGLSYRREAGRYQYDAARGSGVLSQQQADVPGGSFDAKEAYAETRMTLLHDRPWIRELELSGGARHSTFSTFGAHSAWQAGLRWQPGTKVSLRASHATGYRAPGIAELYQVQVAGLDNELSDPCGNDPTPVQQRSCAAHGVPGGSYAQNFDDSYGVVTGGNPGLQPERSRSFNAGIDVHWSGAIMGRASLGYFRTEVTGFISQAATSALLSACIDENRAAACDRITRNADGSLRRIVATAQNFGQLTVRGLDFTLDAQADTTLGRLQGGVLSTLLASRNKQQFAGGIASDDAGHFDTGEFKAYPRWRGLAHLDWQRGPWRASYSVQFIGAFTETVFYDEGPLPHAVPAMVYQDVEAGYEFGGGLRLRLGVTNLADRDPPFVNANLGANTDMATYRLLGRTYFAQLRWSPR